MIPVSVVILTLNEELNLPRCLSSLAWCNDVVVLDSFSTDSTVDVAKCLNARLYQREFDDYASQRRYALEVIQYKNPWLFMLDADEVFPDDLVVEISNKLRSSDESITLYRLRCKYYLFGKWIRHSTTYSSLWLGRLMRVGKVWIDRSINEGIYTHGEVALLDASILHYPFNKGFSAWFNKHNIYSSMEAELKFSIGSEKLVWSDFFESDPAKRRRALKTLIYSMPMRPIIIFIGLYFIKGGFLDGRQGFIYCTLKLIYEFMIDCKINELRYRHKNSAV